MAEGVVKKARSDVAESCCCRLLPAVLLLWVGVLGMVGVVGQWEWRRYCCCTQPF